MRVQNFIGGTGEGRSRNFVCDRTINLFPEFGAAGTGKNGEIAMLSPRPGLTLLQTLGNGPIRGMKATSAGRVFAVSGNTLYELDSFWNATSLGTLNTSSGLVSMDDNGIHLMLVDGADGWTFTFSTDTFAQITDADFPGSSVTRFLDSYFVINEPGTGRFWVTDAYNGASIGASNFATSEGNPDVLRTLETQRRYLWLFNAKTTEVYWDSGDTFPFSRVESAFIDIGCVSADTVQKLNNALFWLSENGDGAGVVYRATFEEPKRISTHEIEIELRRRGSLEAASAWSVLFDGHPFYCLNVGAGSPTLVYDDTTGVWHEWAYLDNGVPERFRASCHMYAFGTHVVGDYENGRVYKLDAAALDDEGREILRRRVVPHISRDNDQIFIREFELEMEPGLGLNGVPTTQAGYNPKVTLRISRDGGHTWGTGRIRQTGKVGERGVRARWTRCGRARDWVFELSMTDPVAMAWTGANFSASKGTD